MLAEIGIMIGAYIITRMVSFITRKGERAETVTVKILAFITVVLALVVIGALIWEGFIANS
jgi:hypothetical protein